MALLTAAPVVQLAATGISFLLVQRLFDRHILVGDKAGTIWICAGIVGLQIAAAMIVLAARRVSDGLIREAVAGYRGDLVDQLLLMPSAKSASIQRSQLHHRMVHDTEEMGAITHAILNIWVASAPMVVVLVAQITRTDWRFAVIFAAMSPLLLVLERMWRPRVRQSIHRYEELLEQYSAGIFFLADSLDLVRLQAAEELERRAQKRCIESLRLAGIEASWTMALADSGHSVIGFLTTGIALALGGWMVAAKSVSPGALVAIFFAMGMLHEKVRILLASGPTIVTGLRAMKSVQDLFGTVVDQPYSGKSRIQFQGGISAKNLTFAYGETPVIRDLSMDIEPGRITVLMGPNGAGNTTLLRLICGFYRPASGQLFADGVPFDALSIHQLRSRIGVVMQSPMMFSGTIMENITFGAPERDEEAAYEAARIAMADDFIRDLPGKYQAHIGDQGVLISGGQRQRISIARAIYRRPKLLILDEPSNHLDRDTALKLIRNLRLLPEKPAIVVITHNQELADCGDVVYRIEKPQRETNFHKRIPTLR